ncbi:MAG: Gfo/Idh/MocA family oxidoreductase [Bryobacterales bacterium]|nr:Gfo/Idh/MocA family oxidoreductase [Bryobacterales bacterium]
MSQPLPVAVIGAGSFGQNHLRVLTEIPGVRLAGLFDASPARAAEMGAQFQCPVFPSLEEAAGAAQAAIVAVPTVFHAEVAGALLRRGLDVLIEKPIASSVEEARTLIELASRHQRILQVGHLERYNPALLALRKEITLPLFFEIHRMSLFTPRSLDIDVVLDLMIHDLDIVLSAVGESPEEIRASGIQILSGKVDIANVRLAFPGGCVANLTASRVSTDKVRKLRLFQPYQYFSVDYTRREGVVFEVDRQDRRIGFRQLDVQPGEPLRLEVEDFVQCVRERRTPMVDGEAACRALKVAHEILDKIEEHGHLVEQSVLAFEAKAARESVPRSEPGSIGKREEPF